MNLWWYFKRASYIWNWTEDLVKSDVPSSRFEFSTCTYAPAPPVLQHRKIDLDNPSALGSLNIGPMKNSISAKLVSVYVSAHCSKLCDNQPWRGSASSSFPPAFFFITFPSHSLVLVFSSFHHFPSFKFLCHSLVKQSLLGYVRRPLYFQGLSRLWGSRVCMRHNRHLEKDLDGSFSLKAMRCLIKTSAYYWWHSVGQRLFRPSSL